MAGVKRAHPLDDHLYMGLRAALAAMFVLAFCGYDAATTKGIEMSLRDRADWQPVYDLGVPLVCVDGSAHFSRPGPRVVDGVEHLASVLSALG